MFSLWVKPALSGGTVIGIDIVLVILNINITKPMA